MMSNKPRNFRTYVLQKQPSAVFDGKYEEMVFVKHFGYHRWLKAADEEDRWWIEQLHERYHADTGHKCKRQE
jgi:hypothetical protein